MTNGFEKILKALANRRRLQILKFLKTRKEATVGEISQHLKITFKATSKHLALLSAVDIIDREQRSLSMFYHLSASPPPVAKSVISYL
jgi:DNA-binding transcriptional ArsR family regulator